MREIGIMERDESEMGNENLFGDGNVSDCCLQRGIVYTLSIYQCV